MSYVDALDMKILSALSEDARYFDVALIAKFKTQISLNAFNKSILKTPHIRRTVTSMVLNVVKEARAL